MLLQILATTLLGADLGPPRALAPFAGFEENRGQAASDVRYLFRGDSWNVAFTSNAMVYERLGIRVEFLGGGGNSRARGVDPLPTPVNILRGADPAKWQLRAPQYRSFVIEDLHAGIDLAWLPADDRRIGWSALIKPGADARALRLRVSGFGAPPSDGPGGLWFSGPLPVFIVSAPTAYQVRNGQRIDVSVRQVSRAEGTIDIEAGAFDPALALVVAGAIGPFPFPAFTSYAGTRLWADREANWILMGATQNGGGYDVWLARWNAKGEPQWLTILGGSAEEQPYFLGFHPSGDALVAGSTNSEDFPVTANAAQARNGGGCFLARLQAASGALVSATYFGGEGADAPAAFTVDPAGMAYAASGTAAVKWDSATNRFLYTARLPIAPRVLAATSQGELFYSGAVANGLGLARLAADGAGHSFTAVLPIPDAKPGDEALPWSLAVDAAGNAWLATSAGDLENYRMRTLLTRVDGKAGRVVYHGFTPAQEASTPELRIDAADHAILIESVRGRAVPTTEDAMLAAPCGTYGSTLTRLAPDGRVTFATYLPNQVPLLDQQGRAWWPRFAPGGAQVIDSLDLQAPTPVRVRCRPSAIAPGQLVTFAGGGFGPSQAVSASFDAAGALPTVLADAQVRFDGVPAPMLFSGRGQIQAQAPYGLRRNALTAIEVVADGRIVDSFEAPAITSAFAFLAAGGPTLRQAAALNEDGTPNSPDNPAAAGSVVSLFGHGAGLLTPPVREGRLHSLTELSTIDARVQVWLRTPNLIPAEVIYAGSAPGLSTAVTQVNIRLPGELPEGARRGEIGVSVYLGTPPRYWIVPDAQVTIAVGPKS